MHLTRNLVKAHAAAPDARTALDRVVDKVGHQLHRVHDKRVHRSKPRRTGAPEPRRPNPSTDDGRRPGPHAPSARRNGPDFGLPRR